MDDFSGSGYFWIPPPTDQEPQAKRRRLESDQQQTLNWQPQHTNTFQNTPALGAHHLLSNRWTFYNNSCNQVPDLYFNQYQHFSIGHAQPLEQWPGNSILNANPVLGEEVEPSALVAPVAPQPEDLDVMVCYGMVSIPFTY